MMRNDLVDLNPGKAMAQAAHAANQFIGYGAKQNAKGSLNETLKEQMKQWINQVNGFGTTIVLAATKSQIEHIIPLGASEGYACDFVFDPTYPIKSAEGEVFTVNAMTCAYVFVAPYTDDYETEIQLRRLSLHP